MITQLTGLVAHKDPEFLIVNVHGVGYKVFVTPEVLAHAPENKEITLWTHLSVRETALDVYGFLTREDLVFYELLIGVPGVGPKSALAVLALDDVQTLTDAISSGDTTYLTKVSGIGAKSAKKIVLELSDKVGKTTEGAGLKDQADTLDALTSMGYSLTQAREALKQLPKETTGANEQLKQALKILAS